MRFNRDRCNARAVGGAFGDAVCAPGGDRRGRGSVRAPLRTSGQGEAPDSQPRRHAGLLLQNGQHPVQALDLAPAIEPAMLDNVIPALDLERAAARSTRAEHRHRLRALSAQRLAPPRAALAPDPVAGSADPLPHRAGRRGVCRSVPAQPFVCRGAQRLPRARSAWASPTRPAPAGGLHRSASRCDQAARSHRGRRALLRSTPPILVRADARAHALASSTGATTTAPGKADVPRPCGGLAAVDQSMIKAHTSARVISASSLATWRRP